MAKPQSDNALDVKIVHIVDDDEAIRSSLDMLFSSVDLKVQTYVDGKVFLDCLAAGEAEPLSCVILDIRMPTVSGIDVFRKLQELDVTAPVIFITGHGDIQMAVQAMHEGAFDFIPKPFRDQELLDRVAAALEKSDSEAKKQNQLVEFRKRRDSLTAREKQVMEFISAGNANKVIAADLNLSQRTVEIHRSHVMEKMKVRSLAELVKISVLLANDADT